MLFSFEAKPPAALTLTPSPATAPKDVAKTVARESTSDKKTPIDSEAEALSQLKAIPIYFASSHALIKPYVSGFDSNVLDAPSLKKVRIDTSWQRPGTKGNVPR
jgi:hypothetical protein